MARAGLLLAVLLGAAAQGASAQGGGETCLVFEEEPIVLVNVDTRPEVGTNGIVLLLTFRNTDIVAHERTFQLQYFRSDAPARVRSVGSLDVSLLANETGTLERTWAVPGSGSYHFTIGSSSFDLEASVPASVGASSAEPEPAVDRLELREVPGARDHYLVLVHGHNNGTRARGFVQYVYASYASRPDAPRAYVGIAVLRLPAEGKGAAVVDWRPDLQGAASDTVTFHVGNTSLTRVVSKAPAPPQGAVDGDPTVRPTALRLETIEDTKERLIVVEAVGGTMRGRLDVPIQASYVGAFNSPWGGGTRVDKVGEARFHVGPGEVAVDFGIDYGVYPTGEVNFTAGPLTRVVAIDRTHVLGASTPLRVEALSVGPAARGAGATVSIRVDVVNPASTMQDGQVLLSAITSEGPTFAGIARFGQLAPGMRASGSVEYELPAGSTEVRFKAGKQEFLYPIGKPALPCFGGAGVDATTPLAPGAATAAPLNVTTTPKNEEPALGVLAVVGLVAFVALVRRRP